MEARIKEIRKKMKKMRVYRENRGNKTFSYYHIDINNHQKFGNTIKVSYL